MMLVKAGKPVDEFIEQLIPHLEPGDIIIDGGNSLFDDTNRRLKYVESKGLLYIGTGVSGGEEGARRGPSIMPGGSPAAWPHVKDIFQAVSAKVEGGVPCCDWVGESGAGHYVKMVHNGIEYGDMQLICEAYNIMKNGLGMSADEMHQVFAEWNKGDLDSYLIEITRDILAKKDEDGAPLVDKILDTAGQKGTGKWTVINSQDLGIPITLMAEAVYSRCVSALKDERVKAARKLKGPRPALGSIAANAEKKKAFIDDIRARSTPRRSSATRRATCSCARRRKEYGWNLNYGGIALMWRGGCIIRSRFLGKIKEAYDNNPKLSNLLLDDYFRGEIKKAQKGWRNIVATAAQEGHPRARLQHRAGVLRPIPQRGACRRTCSRRSAITSARTPTSAWTSRAASSSTPTGPAAAAPPPAALTTPDTVPDPDLRFSGSPCTLRSNVLFGGRQSAGIQAAQQRSPAWPRIPSRLQLLQDRLARSSITAGVRICATHRRHSHRGIAPTTPKAQSMQRHQRGMPRSAPKTRAQGMTSAQAINPKSNSHRLRTGSHHAPMKARAITRWPNASQSVP